MSFLTRTRKRAALSLGIITLLLLALLALSGMMAMMSPMMFDSGETPMLWAAFWTVLSLPVVIIMAIVLAWIFFFVRWYRAALWVTLLPLINISVFVFIAGVLEA